jgi:hypothetical protein
MAHSVRLAYIVEPRFPGGTSAAVAQELRTMKGRARLEVHGVTSRMFSDRAPSPVLVEALDDLGLRLREDSVSVSADRVILHNPAFLKFETSFAPRIIARDLIVVTHENLLRPGGHEPMDIGRCLDMIERASLSLRKCLAPISPNNRATVEAWLAANPTHRHWHVLEQDWTNICDLPLAPPTQVPRDRRGRHSRPGFEKFPSIEDMDLCFPPHAEANVVLGADNLMKFGLHRPHWQMIPFQGIEIASYFNMIDFMIYFTAPTFQESFGRVIAEAIAAGKLVVSDHETASAFGDAVIAAQPTEVDAIVATFVNAPQRYAAQVRRAQERLADFTASAFLDRQGFVLEGPKRVFA